MAYIEWRRGEGVLACRVDRGKIPLGDMAADLSADGGDTGPDAKLVVDPDGVHRKGIKWVQDLGGTAPKKEKGVFVEMGSRALFFINGRFEGELGEGAYRLDRIERVLEKQLHVYHPVVVLLDAGETWLGIEIHNRATADDQKADVFLQIALQLVDPQLFFANLMKSQEEFTEGNLRAALFGPLAAGVGTYVKTQRAGDLETITDHHRDELLIHLQHSCRQVLSAMGFDLVRLNVFSTEMALQNVKRRAAMDRAEKQAVLAEAKADAALDAEKTAWELDHSWEVYEQRKKEYEAEEKRRREREEERLGKQKWQDRHDQLEAEQKLTATRQKIDMHARFMDELLRQNVLDKHDKLETRQQLDQMEQEYRQLMEIREQEWADFQREIDFKKLKQEWEDLDRAAEGKEKEEVRKLEAEQARRQRIHLLTQLDRQLTKELASDELRDSAELATLKLDLARRQIEEKLDLDTVQARAQQELRQVLFEGKRDGAAQDQTLEEQQLKYQKRSADLTRAMEKDGLEHEVELERLQGDVTLAAVDRHEAMNLLQEVKQAGEKAGVTQVLELAALKFESAMRERVQNFDRGQYERAVAAGTERDITTADANAEADARDYTERLRLKRERDELEVLADAKDREKDRKLERLGVLVGYDEQISDGEHRRGLERDAQNHTQEMDKLRVTLGHQTEQQKLANDKRKEELTADIEIERIRKEMTPEQLDALLGHEDARIASYKLEEKEAIIGILQKSQAQLSQAKADGDQRYTEELDKQRAMYDKLFADYRGDFKDFANILKDMGAKGIDGAVAAGAAAMAGQQAAAAQVQGAMKDGQRAEGDAFRKVTDDLTTVKRASVSESHKTSHTTHVHGTLPHCPHCSAKQTVEQPVCHNCGKPLSD